eukprot:1853078-Rhodomonas_salina.1
MADIDLNNAQVSTAAHVTYFWQRLIAASGPSFCAIGLRACCAMPGTDELTMAGSPKRFLRSRYAMTGTDVAYAARCTVTGTDVAYAARAVQR